MAVPSFRLNEQRVRSDTREEEALEALSPFEERDVAIIHRQMLADDDGWGAEQPDEPEGLTDEELKTFVQHEVSQALGFYDSELSGNRVAAYRYYDGNVRRAPAGRSNAVSTDVADVLEWTMPQVMEGLLGTENLVCFDAESEDDEEQAQLETDAVEQVVMKENRGFITIQSAARDALLLRNGILKCYWKNEDQTAQEEYTGLTVPELESLMQPQDGSQVEVTGHEAYDSPPVIDFQTGQPTTRPMFDVTVTRTRPGGRVYVDPVPPDEFLLNRDHDSVDLARARFCGQKYLATRSDLIEDGWDQEQVMDLPPWNDDADGERNERRRYEDDEGMTSESLDPSMQLVWVVECYIRIDADRDGVAELLQVYMAGDEAGLELLGSEPVDAHPFIGGTGILLPHKFYGRSLFDRVWEIQDQKTQILRQLQDNLAHQNNARIAVVAGQVNLDDLLTARPGGIVRQKAPGQMEPLVAPQIGEWGYAHLDWLDKVRTGRAGVSPDTANVAEAIAGDTAHGLERVMSAKEELTGLMIKMLAHTLMDPLFQMVRSLLRRHRDTPMHFKRRERWVEVNPADWGDRSGTSVAHALSHGDRMKQVAGFTSLVSLQERAIQGGGLGTLVSEKNIFNAVTALTRASALGDPTPYWTDPDSEEAQAARQNKQQEAEKAKQEAQASQTLLLEANNAIEQNKEATKRMQAMLADQQKAAERAQELEVKLMELTAKYTEMELKHATDVPGEGAGEGTGTGSASVLPEAWLN